MAFLEKHRFAEEALLKGLFEALTERFPDHAEVLTVRATMEWLNVAAAAALFAWERRRA